MIYKYIKNAPLSLGLLMTFAAVVAESAPLATPEPAPFGPLPSERQLKYHYEMDGLYAFVHWGLNAWTGKEWGYGDENPKQFDPTAFDADQIVGAAKLGGLKGLIFTAKHHDGFCLWPSAFTEHSVKNSPWENGQGDIVKEISDACKRQNIAFGVYLSPWDRNHKDYGKPAYVTYYKNQLRELLTNYGPIFEVWFDGANGGKGWYGGAREKRTIDRGTYYQWDDTFAMVRELQPNACMMSDIGPDIRWICDNHRGMTGDPCWATYNLIPPPGKTTVGIGQTLRAGLQGHRDGKYWMPAEDPMPILKPYWFYNRKGRVLPVKDLVQLYMQTIGGGANLCLNISPDQRGRIPEDQVAALRAFGEHIAATFATNLAADAKLSASNVRGGAAYAAANVLDGSRTTYWATDDAVHAAELVVALAKPVTFNIVDIREYLPLGQRVENWAIDIRVNDQWRTLGSSKAIGSRRLWRGAPVTTEQVRLRLDAPVCLAISDFGLYLEPAEIRPSTMPAKSKAAVDMGNAAEWFDAAAPEAQKGDAGVKRKL